MKIIRLGICFQGKDLTEELVRIFTEDSDCEDEEFKGFAEDNIKAGDNTRPEELVRFVYEDRDDGEDSFTRVKRTGLRIAFRLPMKRRRRVQEKPLENNKQGGSRSGEVRVSEKQQTKEEDDEPQMSAAPALAANATEEDECLETEPSAMEKRATNIKENKAMLEKLLADLSLLSPSKRTSATRVSKRKRVSAKDGMSLKMNVRRNPIRRARPPENFAAECLLASRSKYRGHLLKIKRARIMTKLIEMHRQRERSPRKHCRHGTARALEDTTKEELESVANTSGDKIHDKQHGSTCHQCRQKTLDTKTVCRNPKCTGITGHFCGPCLKNRYGEEIRTALLDSMWVCPPCRGICNCSLCRKRDGRCATGILIHLAKFQGHTNVKDYLDSLQKECSI
ncbi:cell division cycle-associated 7-like protein isoform X1 [Paramormyrops kingsleyae]|uniref:cell division cycle-associated 7-like protein isoform X1 n=1 Tax=Paramormyrops kingsleyae TaxID=1676925 RepID=UPI003B975E0C